MSGALVVHVTGLPAPQGSKKSFVNRHTGRVAMVESSKAVRPWREAVKHAALAARDVTGHDMFTGPVRVTVTFLLPRPRGHSRTGRNAGLLRDSAPAYPGCRPDVDKLMRSTLDALGEAQVWRDDAQVVHILAAKLYALDVPPGARIEVEPMAATFGEFIADALPEVLA